MHSDSQAGRHWMPAALALATLVLFLLLHPYRGIVHDGHLYSLQALNRIAPDLYGNDVFLKFGSQDDFTVFSSLYAWAIAHLGIERAASIITLGSILLFLAGAFLLSRSLTTPLQAAFAVLLLLIAPSNYGPNHVFHYLEEFVTPRQLAEALTLFSLWNWAGGRRTAGAFLALAALFMHPIIALPGILVILTMEWLLPHWQRLGLPAIVLIALAGAAGIGWLPISRWQFDPEWHELATSRVYLSLQNWDLDTWSRVVTVLATLAAAALICSIRLRSFALATILVCVGALLLSFAGGDLLRIVLVLQAQTWRALWLATVVALILTPSTWTTGWNQGGLIRCCLLLLAGSWMAADPVVAVVLAALALLALYGERTRHVRKHDRLLQKGSWLLLALAVTTAVADAFLALDGDMTRVGSIPPFLDRTATLSVGGVVPLILLLAGGYILRSGLPMARGALVSSLAVAALLCAVPVGKTWARTTYPQSVRDFFEGWKELIPEGSDVLWLTDELEIGAGAFHTWLLLERPSFISRTQASNALFSRPAALEMKMRDQSLRGLLPVPGLFSLEVPEVTRPMSFHAVCTGSAVRYLVAADTFADATGIPLPPSAGRQFAAYRLFICP